MIIADFGSVLTSNQALAEMIRVTRAGGWVVVSDADWGTMSVNCTDIDLERRMARVRAEQALNNGFSGRRLYGQFKRLGLAEIHVEIFPYYLTDYAAARMILVFDDVEREAIGAGMISNDELAHWHANLEQADRDGTFFASLNGVMMAGRKVA